MATRKKSSQAKAAQKQQAKKSPPSTKKTKIVQKTSKRKSMRSPTCSKTPRVARIDLAVPGQPKTSKQEQENWLENVMNAAMDAIIIIDRQQKIVLFNSSAEQMFGCTMKDALGQSLNRFIPQPFRKAHADHIKNFEKGASIKRPNGKLSQVTGLRANGEKFALEASISKVLSRKGVLFTVILRDITDSRRMEDELEKEKQFIGTVLDSVGALVLILDLDWRIVRCNRVCETLTGKKIADMRGKPFFDFSVGTEEKAPKVDGLLRAFKGKSSLISFENAWFARDRQLHWIRWFNTVLTDKKGKVLNVIATGVDITERKKSEEEINRLWKHNELILNSAWEGIYGLDRKGKVTFFNRSAEQLTGWKLRDLKGQFLHPLLHHTRPDGTKYSWKNCPIYVSLQQGKTQSVDTDVLWRKDGTCFEVEYTSMPFHTDTKNVEGVVVSFKDISERKKAESALRESEERFIAFMDHSPVVAFLKNKKGQYVYVNQQFEEKLHLSRVHCLGKTDLQLFPPEVARIFKEHDQEVLKAREVLETEETTLDETGKVCYWWVMKFPVYRKEGTVQLGGVAVDVTARKELDEALRLREGELQKNKELLQALGGQLITAQEDERRRISRELHDDMNQRLAVLALNIQSTQKGLGQSTPSFQALGKVYDEVALLSDDVRRLAYQLHPSILDDLGLEVALRAFISDFSKWEGIPIAFVSTDIPFSVAQEVGSCLYRITQECLRNVTKHAKATQAVVKLMANDDGLTLSITDNGKGFTVEKALASKHGLGLIGMQERVRAVQGTYKMKSAPNQGTDVTVWVPMRDVKSQKGKVE